MVRCLCDFPLRFAVDVIARFLRRQVLLETEPHRGRSPLLRGRDNPGAGVSALQRCVRLQCKLKTEWPTHVVFTYVRPSAGTAPSSGKRQTNAIGRALPAPLLSSRGRCADWLSPKRAKDWRMTTVLFLVRQQATILARTRKGVDEVSLPPFLFIVLLWEWEYC